LDGPGLCQAVDDFALHPVSATMYFPVSAGVGVTPSLIELQEVNNGTIIF
jgi:ferredoxin-NADP reductase